MPTKSYVDFEPRSPVHDLSVASAAQWKAGSVARVTAMLLVPTLSLSSTCHCWWSLLSVTDCPALPCGRG